MNTNEVDKFYSKVIRQLVSEIARRDSMKRDLETRGIKPQKVGHCLSRHISHTQPLFFSLVHSKDELQKEMAARYQTIDEDEESQVQPSGTEQREEQLLDEIFQREGSDAQGQSENEGEKVSSINDDLEGYDSKLGPGKNGLFVEEQGQGQPEEGEEEEGGDGPKRLGSEWSVQDIGEIDQSLQQKLSETRNTAKMHILGVYKLGGKRYNPKDNRTDLHLDNVLIKVEGMNREIMLKQAFIRSKKRIHQ